MALILVSSPKGLGTDFSCSGDGDNEDGLSNELADYGAAQSAHGQSRPGSILSPRPWSPEINYNASLFPPIHNGSVGVPFSKGGGSYLRPRSPVSSKRETERQSSLPGTRQTSENVFSQVPSAKTDVDPLMSSRLHQGSPQRVSKLPYRYRNTETSTRHRKPSVHSHRVAGLPSPGVASVDDNGTPCRDSVALPDNLEDRWMKAVSVESGSSEMPTGHESFGPYFEDGGISSLPLDTLSQSSQTLNFSRREPYREVSHGEPASQERNSPLLPPKAKMKFPPT